MNGSSVVLRTTLFSIRFSTLSPSVPPANSLNIGVVSISLKPILQRIPFNMEGVRVGISVLSLNLTAMSRRAS